jgi:hypothetical protein
MSNIATVAAAFSFVADSFEGRAARSEIGERTHVVFDAERQLIDTFSVVGSGVPTRVWHGIAVSVRVPNDADLDAVRGVLEAKGDLIEALFDLFVGVEWDGQNHVGKWADEERRAEILEALHDALHDEGALPTYWEASEWLSPAEGDVRENLLHAVAEHGDLDIAVEKLAKDEEGEARRQGALVEREDIERVLRGYAEDDEDIQAHIEGRRIEERGYVWITRPSDAGQTVVVSYAMSHSLDGRVYRRTVDLSEPEGSPKRATYEYSDDVAEFDPQNDVVCDEEGDEPSFERAL